MELEHGETHRGHAPREENRAGNGVGEQASSPFRQGGYRGFNAQEGTGFLVHVVILLFFQCPSVHIFSAGQCCAELIHEGRESFDAMYYKAS